MTITPSETTPPFIPPLWICHQLEIWITTRVGSGGSWVSFKTELFGSPAEGELAQWAGSRKAHTHKTAGFCSFSVHQSPKQNCDEQKFERVWTGGGVRAPLGPLWGGPWGVVRMDPVGAALPAAPPPRPPHPAARRGGRPPA